MRTNLTGSSAATARSLAHPDLRSRHALAITASVIVAAFAATAPYQRAAAGEINHPLFSTTVDRTAVCHRVDEVKSSLFPRMDVAAYDFTGPDAGRLQGALDNVAEQSAPPAILVRLVLLPAMDEAIAFQFGADGCHTVTIGLDFAAMENVFETAGVAAPFGRTFYQLPSISL